MPLCGGLVQCLIDNMNDLERAPEIMSKRERTLQCPVGARSQIRCDKNSAPRRFKWVA